MSIENAYNIWAHQYDTNENRTRDLDKKCTIETLNNLITAQTAQRRPLKITA